MKELIASLFSGVIGFFQSKQEIKAADAKRRAELISDRQSNNHEWELANLADKDKFLRACSFAIFVAPFVMCIFDPVAVEEYFTVGIKSVPDWWQKTFVGITGSVWGIASLKNALPAIVSGVKKAIKE